MTGLQNEDSGRQKSSRALKTISEAAELLDVPQHVLRFWETKFSQIKPLKRNGGRRFYRPEDIDTLVKIKFLLYRQGYTIKGAKKVFDDKNSEQIFARLSQNQEKREAAGMANDNAPSVDSLAEAVAGLESTPTSKRDISQIVASLKALSRELKGDNGLKQ